MLQDCHDLLDCVEGDCSIRTLFLTGSGGSFCTGGDLKSIQGIFSSPNPFACAPEAMRRRLQDIRKWLRWARDVEITVVVTVGGPAGAGFSLALAAAFVLASERASFCMSFATVGLLLDMGSLYALLRAVGMLLANQLMFTGRRSEVIDAQRCGIVHAIHPADRLGEEARRFAQRFVAAPQEALALMKRGLNRTFESSYDTLLDLECQSQALASAVLYYAAVLDALLNGKPAPFDWDREAQSQYGLPG